ncbi:DUF559 domain-containing protein [Marmoricola endophyticus]|uniref:DUF559 domain-containing protein n=1 Tax=Marmoricola endophyticus TaxID=2040280 RepID=UPI001668461B|nr:DUF559 domain-containing protein [Marmoricola endophyticus]
MTALFPRLPDGLPAARPFTVADAAAAGVPGWTVERLAERGALRRMFAGVYVAATEPESLVLRADALRLVVPPDAVVVDETAGWLHGATRVLAPSADGRTPRLHVFCRTPGRRLRNELVDSGERGLLPRDVEIVTALRVTTALRTACDLGRLRRREQAIATLDSMLRLGAFDRATLEGELRRFGGMRGVRQLRELVPLADSRAESPPESVLRLRCLDAGLPALTPQWVVRSGAGREVRLDLALPEVRLAAEYDGSQHHTLSADREHDRSRRAWLASIGWTVVVVRREDLRGDGRRAVDLVRQGLERAIDRHRT